MKLSSVRVTILVENRSERADLGAEHGFAALVESPDGAVLFDTGASDLVVRNARALRADLRGVNAVALSHGHYDHCGGLSAVLEELDPEVKVFAHPAALERKYAVRPGKPTRSIGMPQIPGGSRLSLSAGTQEVLPGMVLLGQIPRSTAYEDTGGPFFLDPDGANPDFLPDDTSLLVATPSGPVLITGCAHSGIVNTVHSAAALLGEKRFAAILGGMHLTDASARRIDRTISDLSEFEVGLIFPAHCTGNAAREAFRDAYGERYRECPVGTVLEF